MTNRRLVLKLLARKTKTFKKYKLILVSLLLSFMYLKNLDRDRERERGHCLKYHKCFCFGFVIILIGHLVDESEQRGSKALSYVSPVTNSEATYQPLGN